MGKNWAKHEIIRDPRIAANVWGLIRRQQIGREQQPQLTSPLSILAVAPTVPYPFHTPSTASFSLTAKLLYVLG